MSTSTTRHLVPSQLGRIALVLAAAALGACAGDDELDPGAGGGPVDGGGAEAAGGAEDGGTGGEDAVVGTGAGAGPTSCTDDASCDDDDACTIDVCDRATSGEFTTGQCSHVPVDGPACRGGSGIGDGPGGGDPPQGDDPGDAVDPSCADLGGGAPVFLPFEALGEPGLPASCSAGFEWQNCRTTFEVPSSSPAGAGAVTLVVDLATYTAPDWLRIVAVAGDGEETIILDTCRVRTADYVDPTHGELRPPEDSIRRFEVDVPQGTRSLRMDSSNAGTPFYMRVLGLCDFDVAGPAQCNFRPASP